MEKFIKKRRSKITTKQVIQDFKRVHGELYNYSLVTYKTMHTKVKIICSQHGQFEQTPNAHIRQKQGCPVCSIKTNKLRQSDNTETFLAKVKLIHKDRYIYTKTLYGKNAHEKVVLTCRIHGDFYISPNRVISQKAGCPKCSKISQIRKLKAQNNLGWSRTNWIKRLKGKSATLYILKCWNQEEEFFKIGITGNSVSRRYRGPKALPYNYEVVHVVESKDIGYIYDLEHRILKQTNSLKYIPKKPFVGSLLECRNKEFNYSAIH